MNRIDHYTIDHHTITRWSLHHMAFVAMNRGLFPHLIINHFEYLFFFLFLFSFQVCSRYRLIFCISIPLFRWYSFTLCLLHSFFYSLLSFVQYTTNIHWKLEIHLTRALEIAPKEYKKTTHTQTHLFQVK